MGPARNIGDHAAPNVPSKRRRGSSQAPVGNSRQIYHCSIQQFRCCSRSSSAVKVGHNRLRSVGASSFGKRACDRSVLFSGLPSQALQILIATLLTSSSSCKRLQASSLFPCARVSLQCSHASSLALALSLSLSLSLSPTPPFSYSLFQIYIQPFCKRSS